MSVPKVKIETKNGVKYESNIDRATYTIHELSRAALRDVGKFVTKKARKNAPKRTGKLRKNLQYWVKSKTPRPELQIGYKPDGFYGAFFELGTDKLPKLAPIRRAVEENIDDIRRIEGAYLSAIEDENRALGLIDEEEEVSDDDDE